MGSNVTQKILNNHLVAGELSPGKPITIKIDQTLTQDATGTMAYLQFETMGISRPKVSLAVSYIDHNMLQDGFENPDDHRYLTSIAERYGIYLSRPGNGICHQVHLERFGEPGKTLVGSDSHTPTAGGLGMFAVGVGGLDVAVSMAGKPFHLTCPRVMRISLTGKLPDWVSAKDVILKVLSILSSKGNVGWVLEYGGDGINTLSVPERATITNMGAETGVTTSLFPSDELTRKFLKAQGREQVWQELLPDTDAEYERTIDINMSNLVPLISQPHNPDRVVAVEEIAGLAVDQVCIGSCTNSSYKDLATAAAILRGKTVHPRLSLAVAPGSRQVLQMISKDGILADLVASGARIMESSCGFCIGNGQAPPTDAVSLRTSNRNFKGRSGTPSANLYLCSPEVAATAAITGEVTDPRTLGIPYPGIEMPEKFAIDDCMIVFPKPEKETAEVEIIRGPNIGEPPKNDPLPSSFSARVAIVVGDKITTDHIIRAGPRLKFRSNIEKYSRFVFEEIDPEFDKRCKRNRSDGFFNIIVAGESYGQGSSREHAAICPMHLGVKAVLAVSIERIHTANLINFGILPLFFSEGVKPKDLSMDEELEFSDIIEALRAGKDIEIKRKSGGTLTLTYDLTERQREIIIAGGLLNYIRRGGE